MTPELLKETLRAYLSAHPEDMKSIMDICSESLNGFLEKQKNMRNGLAINAIDSLLIKKVKANFEPNDLVWIVDTVHHQFPNGWVGVKSSIIKKYFLSFLNAAEKYELMSPKNSYWLRTTKELGPWADSIFNDPDYAEKKAELEIMVNR